MSDLHVSRVPEKAAPNLGDLVDDALHQVKSLVQAEFSLARRELTSEVTSALGAVAMIAAAVLVAQATITTLGVLLVLALGAGWASVGVVLGLAVISAALVVIGITSLKRRKLPHTTARIARDAKQVLETVK